MKNLSSEKIQFMFYVMIQVRRFNHELQIFVHYFKSRFIIKVVITKRSFANATQHLMSHHSVRRRRHGRAYITQGLQFTSAGKFRSTLSLSGFKILKTVFFCSISIEIHLLKHYIKNAR